MGEAQAVTTRQKDEQLRTRFRKLDKENAVTPSYASEGDAGLDLHALEAVTIAPGERALVKTGIAIELHEGTVGYICSRSGLAAKHGVFVLNAPGVIDNSYRGDLGVVLFNSGKSPFEVQAKDRIAQLVIQPFITVELEETEGDLNASSRGVGGFGSTGVRHAEVAV